MDNKKCSTCTNPKCTALYQSETAETDNCCGYIPKLRLSVAELFVIEKLLNLTNLSEKYNVVAIDENTDGIKVMETGEVCGLNFGLLHISENMPDDNSLRDKYWVNDPEIDIWNSLKKRLLFDEN